LKLLCEALADHFVDSSQGWRWLGEHLYLVGVSMAIAILIAVPLGMALVRRPKAASVVIGGASVAQTVPSLAMIALIFVLVGPLNELLPGFLRIERLGPVPSIIALVLYAMLPILVNTVTGLQQVSPAVREAARGMGMTGREMLFQVELPLALPIVMAGIRTATVWTVGIATICALVGSGGLGTPIFQGIRLYNNALILIGVIPASLLALTLSWALGRAERSLTPPGLRPQKA